MEGRRGGRVGMGREGTGGRKGLEGREMCDGG